MNQEFFNLLESVMRLVPSILVIVLACLAKKLVGKGWLIVLVVSDLVAIIGSAGKFVIVGEVMRENQNRRYCKPCQ